MLLQILAKVGAEMQEDAPPVQGAGVAPANWADQVSGLRAHAGYADKNHPEHGQIMAQLTSLYEKKHGTKPQMLGGGATISL